VVRFDVLLEGREVFWIVLDRDGSSICQADPGIEVDVHVTADGMALQRVYSGWMSLDEAIADGTVTVHGRAPLVRDFPGWFAWSPFLETTRARARTGGVSRG
jgi:hypothetical protein